MWPVSSRMLRSYSAMSLSNWAKTTGIRLKGIECARGHVSGLGAHDHGSVSLGERLAQRLGFDNRRRY
jgi:hypothetical protein